MSETPPLRPARPRATAGPILDALRAEILSLALAPGAVLSRAELQERFGLSSTPVRDALIRLREEGLVEIFPQHATRVSPIDAEAAGRAQFLRRAVELELVRGLAADPDPELVGRLRGLVRKQAALGEIGDHEAFTETDRDFHRAMYEAAGLAELWQLVRREGGHIDRLRRLHLPVEGKMRDILRDHAAIVDAIEAGKPKRARAAMRGHLSRSLDSLESLKESHPGYFA